MTAPEGGRGRWRIALVAAAVLAGCSAQAAASMPAAVLSTAAIPEGWVTVSNTAGTIQLTLPPWLEVFDNHGAIFANERPAAAGAPIPISLWAQGPAGIEDQPLPGEDLVAWVERRLENSGSGDRAVSRVALPAGAGLRYDRIDSADTPTPWRIVVFAIETPQGAAWLQLDGPPDSWAARAEDLERVAMLFRVR